MLNLSSNELIHPLTERLISGARDQVDADDLRCYPRPAQLKEIISTTFNVPERGLELAPGSKCALLLILLTLREYRRLVVPVPNYQPILELGARLGYRVAAVEPGGRDLTGLFDTLTSAAPSVVYLSNPNSPTGAIAAPELVVELLDLCGSRGHKLVIDECYADFAGIAHAELVAGSQSAVVVHSLSKSFGLAGARIAWVLADEKFLGPFRGWLAAEHVAGASSRAAGYLLAHTDTFKKAWGDLADVHAGLVSEVPRRLPGWHVWDGPTGGNFVASALPSFHMAEAFSAKVQDAGLLRVRVFSTTSTTTGQASACIRFTIADQSTMNYALSVMESIWRPLTQLAVPS